MRELLIVGIGADGDCVIAETVPQRTDERPERFVLPVDAHLHAAARGDLPRLGRGETEQETEMRPREIQARIRAGESVEDLASVAGVSAERIDRFAYPVLLERSRAAELARQAHPVLADGPDVRTLDDVVADTFRRRGHDLSTLDWDAWRGDSGRWVVQLRWSAGRSENRAHWTYHPGAQGGTVTAIDEHAQALIDPEADTPLRTVPERQPEPEPAQPRATGADGAGDDDTAGPEEAPAQELPEALAVPDDAAVYRPSESAAERNAAKRGRKNHPIVPSWEDVLLGTRSSRE